MYCAECGKKIGEDVKLCPECGTQNKYTKGVDSGETATQSPKKENVAEGVEKTINMESAGSNKAVNVMGDTGKKLFGKIGGDSTLWKIIVISCSGFMVLATILPYASVKSFYSISLNMYSSESPLLITLGIATLGVAGVGIAFTLLGKKKVVIGMGIAAASIAAIVAMATLIIPGNIMPYFGSSIVSLLDVGFYLFILSGFIYCVASIIYFKK